MHAGSRCGRHFKHAPHDWVTSPQSKVERRCPGYAGPRDLAQLVADEPALATVPALGVIRHSLAVSAA